MASGAWKMTHNCNMPPSDDDAQTGASSDEYDVGWGGREWAESGDAAEAADGDLTRLLEDRPPHHEDRER